MPYNDIYVGANYRHNLIKYWQQFSSDWNIPEGYHVNHIKPKCTFEDNDDPLIHHPRNLIALHSDDHVSIHKCRGDKFVNEKLILSIKGNNLSVEQKDKLRKNRLGAKYSTKTKKKMSDAKKGRKYSKTHKQNMSLSRGGNGIHVGYAARYKHRSNQVALLKEQFNDQYGIWITNGVINKRSMGNIALPDNFIIGRTDFSIEENK